MPSSPHTPPGNRAVPGIPSKQVWDAASFQTPPVRNSFFFSLHWLASLPNPVPLIVLVGFVLLSLWFLNII